MQRLSYQEEDSEIYRVLIVNADDYALISQIHNLIEFSRSGLKLIVICLANHRAGAVVGSFAIVAVEAASRASVEWLETGKKQLILTEGALSNSFSEFAKNLAPIMDARFQEQAKSNIPQTVSFMQIQNLSSGRSPGRISDQISANWAETALETDRLLNAKIGHDGSSVVEISLLQDGPHALVAGTTGAGKSELLHAWILALASNYSPAELNFLMVDYKGGAAFHRTMSLPHAVGVITDLTPQLALRALTSLKAELKRRERLFADYQVKDISSYLELKLRSVEHGLEKLPELAHLLIVVDEFATLKAEVPEFVSGLIDIAARGRSLGFNLILATQRPAGVVNEQIRANTNLRIALRLADKADSMDVIGTGQAAQITAQTPGRAVLSKGSLGTQMMQVASTNIGLKSSLSITEASLRSKAQKWDSFARAHFNSAPKDESQRVVAAIKKAASGYAKPRSPWLPPLPEYLSLESLEKIVGAQSAKAIALLDHPERQRFEPLNYQPEKFPFLQICGVQGSGVSSAISALIKANGVNQQFKVYLISDEEAINQDFKAAALVSDAFELADGSQLMRLLKNALRQKTKASKPVVIIIDSFAAVKSVFDTRTFDEFQKIIGILGSQSHSRGIYFIFGTQSLQELPGSLSTIVSDTWRMKLSAADEMLVSKNKKLVQATAPAGRIIIDEKFGQIVAPEALETDQSRSVREAERNSYSLFMTLGQEIPSLLDPIEFEQLNSSSRGYPLGLNYEYGDVEEQEFEHSLLLAHPAKFEIHQWLHNYSIAAQKALGLEIFWLLEDSDLEALLSKLTGNGQERLLILIPSLDLFTGSSYLVVEKLIKDLFESSHLVVAGIKLEMINKASSFIKIFQRSAQKILIDPNPADIFSVFANTVNLPRPPSETGFWGLRQQGQNYSYFRLAELAKEDN